MTLLRTPLLLLFPLLWFGCDLVRTGSGEVGDPCDYGMECASEMCLSARIAGENTGWHGGMCTRSCNSTGCDAQSHCTDLGDGRYCLPACETVADCRSGYLCHSTLRVCYPDCQYFDCPEGTVCGEAGECVYEWPALGALGSECLYDGQCASGLCIAPLDANGVVTGWTGGVCSRPCGQGGCDEGFDCAVLDDKPYCLATCGPDKPCREGYVCHPDEAICFPDCNSAWDCGDGFTCRADGVCEWQWPELLPLGAPCAHDGECLDGWCLEATRDGQPTGWAGGSCALPCGAGGSCPLQARCMVLEQEAWCLPACSGPPGSPECRQGYICDPFTQVCLPDCHNEGWDCGTQYHCNLAGVCAPYQGGR